MDIPDIFSALPSVLLHSLSLSHFRILAGRQRRTAERTPRMCAALTANTKFSLLTSDVPQRNPQAFIRNSALTSARCLVALRCQLNGRSDRNTQAGRSRPRTRRWARLHVSFAPPGNEMLHKMCLILCVRYSKRHRKMQFGISCADLP